MIGEKRGREYSKVKMKTVKACIEGRAIGLMSIQGEDLPLLFVPALSLAVFNSLSILFCKKASRFSNIDNVSRRRRTASFALAFGLALA